MKNIYRRHRFPPSVIQYAVWLYYRFNLSIRDVEDLLAERNISVSYEAIRLWVNKLLDKIGTKVCAAPKKKTPGLRLHLLSGRSIRQDQWETALSLACS